MDVAHQCHHLHPRSSLSFSLGALCATALPPPHRRRHRRCLVQLGACGVVVFCNAASLPVHIKARYIHAMLYCIWRASGLAASQGRSGSHRMDIHLTTLPTVCQALATAASLDEPNLGNNP